MASATSATWVSELAYGFAVAVDAEDVSPAVSNGDGFGDDARGVRIADTIDGACDVEAPDENGRPMPDAALAVE